MPYVRISEAATLAETSSDYLHKLRKTGELDAYAEKRGKLNYWYVNTDCPRFKKLLDRLNPKEQKPAEIEVGHPMDWVEWEAILKRGESWMVKSPCTERTLQNYRYYIKRFFSQHPVLNRNTLLAVLSDYEAKETRHQDFFTTKHHFYCALMTVAKYLVHKGYEDHSLIDQLKTIRPHKKIKKAKTRCYREETIHEIVDVIQNGKTKKNSAIYSRYNAVLNTALYYTAFYTGARSSEICGILMEDLDLETGWLLLCGKGRKERYVGIPKQLINVIRTYLKFRPKGVSNHLFLGDTGRPLKPDYLGRRIRRAGKWIQKQVSPHNIRHTSLTWMLNVKKAPLPIVRDAAGHNDLKTTNRYAHPTSTDVVETMRQF